jgi:hypothetical protein
MRRLIIFCLFAFIILSCTKPQVEIPAGILKKEQLVPILADVHIAQAASVMNAASDSTRYSLSELMKYIFKIHNTTQAQYDSSVGFYTHHPEIMEQIYDSVITELSKKQGEVEGSSINKPPAYGR